MKVMRIILMTVDLHTAEEASLPFYDMYAHVKDGELWLCYLASLLLPLLPSLLL
jgi:hypothetical protein